MAVITVAVPCYNEEEVLNETCKRLLDIFDKMQSDKLISSSSRIVFVDDGSKDRTWEIIEKLQKQFVWDKLIVIIWQE